MSKLLISPDYGKTSTISRTQSPVVFSSSSDQKVLPLAMNDHGDDQSQYATRRLELIEAARQLFEEQGLSRTTVKSITERVGVARSLFYHYFRDKNAVILAVFDEYVEDHLETLTYWTEGRENGSTEHALESIVKILRLGIFENDSLLQALITPEFSALYLTFLHRVAYRVAGYFVASSARINSEFFGLPIDHVYETFYVLFLGIVGFIRQHPQVSDDVLMSVLAQTLHLDRSNNKAAY
jgi:AcrR family transcriptional regulator